jgi:hypothetical protein
MKMVKKLIILRVVHTATFFSGVLIGNDIEHDAVSAYL